MGPSDFETRVLVSLGEIGADVRTIKDTMADHTKRINALESKEDIETGKKSAFGWVKTPLQMASGGALTLFVQKIFHQ